MRNMIDGKVKRYLEDLGEYVNSGVVPIENLQICTDEVPGQWEAFRVGDFWGGRDVTAWFRGSVDVPTAWIGDSLVLELNMGDGDLFATKGAEGLLLISGKPVQALDMNHTQVRLEPEMYGGGRVEFLIKAFSGLQDEKRCFEVARLCLVNPEAEEFYLRASVTFEAIQNIKEHVYDRNNLLQFLDEAINMIDFRVPRSEEFYASVKKANCSLKTRLSEYKPAIENKPMVHLVGHSHIDVAWLWRLRHTREKVERTFTTMLNLMDRYPEFKYIQTQPQLYEFIKEDNPEIYEQIKKRVQAGQWEVTGGMWVEADCNIPSGESLVRQFLYGTRFIKEEFGKICTVLWLPDVFGYSWALPQIIKRSGLKYFMTTKISWSQFNRPEHDTFLWKGMDGTEVLTHFITTPEYLGRAFYAYNAVVDPKSVQGIWDNYRQKDINDELLLAYGWGDGGGGPTEGMIETAKIIAELPVLPDVKFTEAEEFFAGLEERVESNPDLPVWDGELYLEFHRGTYTSQGKVKKNNRVSEFLYHDVELFNSVASLVQPIHKYPKDVIDSGWKTILLNQFHDILPGSSIGEVYEDSEEQFAEIIETGRDTLNKGLTTIAENITIHGENLVVFNSLPWERDGFVSLPWTEELAKKCFMNSGGDLLPTKVVGKNEKELLVRVQEIPALGYKAFRMVDGATEDHSFEDELIVRKDYVENRFYQIKLDQNGHIISWYDKETDRELVPDGAKANVIRAFEDRPMNYSAWDIDVYYKDKEYIVDDLEEISVEEAGPDRGVLTLRWNFLDSTIEQRMVIYADKRRVDFKTEVDWHQNQILLKAAFPVDLRATKATYEIQFGNVERPTHDNTTWDYAKFETAAQKWADLSERSYGVSLLNDCKYGYDVKGNTLSLTLLKSGVYPDPNQDQGHHSFTYSLYPHPGDWLTGGTAQEAYNLNCPLKAVIATSSEGELPSHQSFITATGQSTMLETVKRAEDDDSLILRFYEYGNSRETVRVDLFKSIQQVWETNLMEETERTLDLVTDNSFEFTIKPYQIKTFKVRFK
ncbi:MAG TPA: alpha-mannosidase [Firmicutes bacterium]|jgi:alpha-mannosidase|nr:alpha-mannosidase [Bacillota bacterium]